MNKKGQFGLLKILFIINFIEMILEMAAARVLSPYFGNSQYVWTAIIGIIMLAGSLGNVIGGRAADKRSIREYGAYHFLLAGIGIMIIYAFGETIALLSSGNKSVMAGTVIASILLFFLPAYFLSCITPCVLKVYVPDGDSEGRYQGISHAVIGLGALSGTFFGGFCIVPVFGVRTTLLILTAFALLGAAEVCRNSILRTKAAFSRKEKKTLIITTLLLISMVCGSLFADKSSSKPEIGNVVAEFDTEYTHIQVKEAKEDYNGHEEDVLLYSSAGAYSSGTFTKKELRNELVFEYLKKYDDALNVADADSALMIGGAAYAYPKYYISHFPEKTMDVVEIDGKATDIAKEYFYLDDLLKEYGDERLKLITDDGRVYLNRNDKKYDVVFNDAFSGGNPVASLATDEAVKQIKARLNENGVYASNILGAVQGDNGRFLRSEFQVLQENFKNVYAVPVRSSDRAKWQNYIVFATDGNYSFEGAVPVIYEGNEVYLTDNNCPVDQMTKTKYMEE